MHRLLRISSHAAPLRSKLPLLPGACRSFTAAAAEAPILVDRLDNGIVRVTFNRPSSMNAMTVEMGEAFEREMHKLRDEPQSDGLRAVILTGAGKAFSAGGDLDFLVARAHDSGANNSALMRRFYQRFLSVRQLPVPVIAAINGPAVGAGLCVALACDVRVAAPRAKLGLTFTALGIHPGMGASHILPALVGPQTAARLLLTGELVLADEAKELGLVASVADDAEVHAMELAQKIAANPPTAVRTLTRSLRFPAEDNIERALWREADSQALCYAEPEFLERVTAMKNKASSKKK